MQRGEVGNSTEVLTRLAGSGRMLVFPGDSAGVLSRTDGSGETPEMKTYTLQILGSRTKLPFPLLKHCDFTEFFLCLTELVQGEPCLSMG